MNIMIRLGRLARANLERGERGAVATLVAVLLGGGVVLGFAAVSIDVGSLMWERRQLQNAADAGALALAQTCAEDLSQCSGSDTATVTMLQQLNDGNNTKDAAGGFNTSVYAQGICGTGTATTAPANLPTCAAPASGLVNCPPVPSSLPSGVPYVEVHTQTREADGTSIMPTWLIRTLTGGSTGETVGACARAAWGAAGGTSKAELPLTISACDWMDATGGTVGGGGGAYHDSPDYDAYPPNGYTSVGSPAWPDPAAAPPAQNPGDEVIFMLQNPPSGQTPPPPCPSWNGHTLPGGFGILETDTTDCDVKQYNFGWVHTDPGSSVDCDLSSYVGKVVNIPVFDCTASSLPSSAGIPPAGGDCTEGNGSNSWYHVAGWAQFYLSGFRMTTTAGVPNGTKSLVNNQWACGGSEACISGWFLQGSLNATSISGPISGPGYFGSYTTLPAG